MVVGNVGRFAVALFAIAITGASVRAQITGDDGSANYLAAQCAISSGLPAENYSAYGEKLALTLSSLDAAQQERVFGFLPTPGGTGPAMANATVSNPVTGGDGSIPEGGDGLLGGLLGGVTEIIQGLQQPSNPAPPVIAGTPPAGSGTGGAGNQGPSSAGDETGATGAGSTSGGGTTGAAVVDDGNNGHGDSGGYDPSNPGNDAGNSGGASTVPGQSPGDDGNNGHGDSSGFDPSNPGISSGTQNDDTPGNGGAEESQGSDKGKGKGSKGKSGVPGNGGHEETQSSGKGKGKSGKGKS